jgi:hypothetical protein
MKAKNRVRSILALTALTAAALMALAPGASADFGFEPGSVFAKTHEPLNQELPGFYSLFMGVFQGEGNTIDGWEQEIRDAIEPTQAGGHPDFTTSFRWPDHFVSGQHPKTLVGDTPAGSVGNPRVVPRCSPADFHLAIFGACAPESQVGEATTRLFGDLNVINPIWSLVPSVGDPALLAYKPFGISILLAPDVRSDGDYGLSIPVDGLPVVIFDILGSTVTLWGVPHDPVHDAHRVDSFGTPGASVAGVPKPFLSTPTNCQSGPVAVNIKTRSWEEPGNWIEESDEAPEPTGCDQISFEPSLSARPSTNVADSPSGLEVDLEVPQNENCEFIPESQLEEEEMLENTESLYDCGLATSHLKDAVVTFPEGLTINPASANGLDGCSPSEAGLTTPLGEIPAQFNGEPANCPDASRIGSVEVDTPLLDNPMQGSVFLADPYANPYQSLISLYIAVDDEKTGIVATLPGKVEVDPLTGKLKGVFQDNPQLPFEHFFIHFKQGPHAPLRTPGCGTYETTGELTPYSDPESPVATSEDWAITQGPNGSCDTPNAPDIDAGSITPLAGASTPTVVELRRADGTQEFSKVNLTLPPGLTGKLAGISQCPDSALAAAEAKSGQEEVASPSCPANSRIGSVYVQAGAGPDPYNTTASAYLAGPYKGAPASIAIIAPATAGPFDLGTVVVRIALRLDPSTGQIIATTDEIPHILKGIPLDIRSTKLVMDRDNFTRNGTSCDPSAFSGEEISTLAVATPLSERFQLAECSSLSFKPKLAIRLFGSTKRGGHPALKGSLQMPEGGANVAKASVALPHSEFLDQAHIGTVCTRVQFAEGDGNGSACPPGSIYGSAIAISPLVDYALQGPAILRSSSHKLPDLVIALHGPPSQPIQVAVAARVDSVNGGLRSTFEGVPDLPVSKFVLSLKGGKKGLFQNSTDICQGTHRANAVFDAQNGKRAELRPALRNGKCGKARKGHRRGHR